MGHTRLGRLPTSQKWDSVIAKIASPSDESIVQSSEEYISEIANEVLEAAQAGMMSAKGDAGLIYTFYLLTQTVLAAREDSAREYNLAATSLLERTTDILGLSIELQEAIDNHLFSTPEVHASDISEMAQKAAGEALTDLTTQETLSLFEHEVNDIRKTIRKLSSKNGFATLGQQFFGRFMSHFLNFYLSRATAAHVGGTRINNIVELSEFNRALDTHCLQTARIVRDFAGEWFSKTEYLEGIDLENTSGFVAVALDKLHAEMKRQGEEGK